MSGPPDFEFIVDSQRSAPFPAAEPPPEDGPPEETLPEPGPRRTRWPRRPSGLPTRPLSWITYAALALVIVATLISRWPGDSGKGHAAPPSVTPNGVPTSVATSAAADDVSLIAELKFVADTPGTLTDHNRGDTSDGQCPSMPIGQSPLTGVTLALHRYLPQFRVLDSSMTLDRTTAPCDIEVRARDDQGRLVVIIVTAPPNPAQADQMEIEHEGGLAYVAVATTSTPNSVAPTCIPGMQCGGSRLPLVPPGWRVEVGMMSTVPEAPSTDQLLTLAYDPELIW